MRTLAYAHAIKMVREERDLTQKEFADKLGKRQSTISSWEVGRTKPSRADISDINRIFGTDLKPQYDNVQMSLYDSIPKINLNANNIDYITPDDLIVETVIESRAADIRLLTYLDALNPDGIKEALKRVAELTEIPRYKKGTSYGNGEETRK